MFVLASLLIKMSLWSPSPTIPIIQWASSAILKLSLLIQLNQAFNQAISLFINAFVCLKINRYSPGLFCQLLNGKPNCMK
jgi:hypothetical protein